MNNRSSAFVKVDIHQAAAIHPGFGDLASAAGGKQTVGRVGTSSRPYRKPGSQPTTSIANWTLAINFAEDGPRLSADHLDRIVGCFESAGATAKVPQFMSRAWLTSPRVSLASPNQFGGRRLMAPTCTAAAPASG
jgi:hypothetical protein